ncbi:MAG TPA: hypothetical protein VGN17_12120 [Bryobacteraceae bacterium]|jgi:hypothetical protein
MRTTLNLDQDVFEKAKSYAAGRSLPLGTAVSELIRRGLSARRSTRVVHGLHLVDLPPDSPKVTSQRVRALEAEDTE